MNIAIIPARGGSKRIPGKNKKLFAGKPLIAYSIEVALNCGVFDDVVVSTDDEDIASISLHAGASWIIERPAKLADDFTGTTPVVTHAIEQYERDKGDVEFVCCLYATAPFLQASYLRQGLESLKLKPASQFAFSVTSYPFPIQRAIRLQQEGVSPFNPEAMSQRSQDLEEAYHDAGQFYWGRKHAWLNQVGVFKPHSVPIILPRHLVQDIDTYEDWLRAELMFKAYIQDN